MLHPRGLSRVARESGRSSIRVVAGLAAGALGVFGSVWLTAGGSATTAAAASWPGETGSTKVSRTITVSGTFDGGMKRYYGIGDGGQSEGQDPVFVVQDGGTIKNVIIGTPAGDGIHCKGSCTIQNVWWLDVGEDAATFKGTSSSTRVLVNGGGAKQASDKVFQHNGGGTVTINNFQVSDFGKLYRSCGNCTKQYQRSVTIQNVTATAPGKTLAGINTNYGDTAILRGITIVNDSKKKISICDRFTGNNKGDEPTKTGKGADGRYCQYSSSDISYR